MSRPKTNDEKQLRTYAAGLRDGEKRVIQKLIYLLQKDHFKYFVRGDMLDWLSAGTKKGKSK